MVPILASHGSRIVKTAAVRVEKCCDNNRHSSINTLVALLPRAVEIYQHPPAFCSASAYVHRGTSIASAALAEEVVVPAGLMGLAANQRVQASLYLRRLALTSVIQPNSSRRISTARMAESGRQGGFCASWFL